MPEASSPSLNGGSAGRRRPSREDLARAAGSTVPDVIARNLQVLFCGINPGLYSGAVGHHFARPGNRFWTVLHLSGLVPELLAPEDEHVLLTHAIGITNLVARATATADELSRDELREGARRLARKTARWKPRWVAFLGMGAYRAAFERPRATIGVQPEPVGGAPVYLLPNPSGLQARYQLPELVELFQELRAVVGRP
jgi:TDG/mug DNA glycosylase family protein